MYYIFRGVWKKILVTSNQLQNNNEFYCESK